MNIFHMDVTFYYFSDLEYGSQKSEAIVSTQNRLVRYFSVCLLGEITYECVIFHPDMVLAREYSLAILNYRVYIETHIEPPDTVDAYTPSAF